MASNKISINGVDKFEIHDSNMDTLIMIMRAIATEEYVEDPQPIND